MTSLEKILSETWFNDDEVADEFRREDYTKLILKLISAKYPNIATKIVENKEHKRQINPESFVLTHGAFKKPELEDCLEILDKVILETPSEFSVMTIIDTLRTVKSKLDPSLDNCNWILSLTAFFVYRGITDWQIPYMRSAEEALSTLNSHNDELIYDSASDPELYSFNQILKNQRSAEPERLYYRKTDNAYNFYLAGINNYNIPAIGGSIGETSTDDGGNDIPTINVLSQMKEQMYDMFIIDLKQRNIELPSNLLSEEFENESISIGGGAFSGGPMGIFGRSKKKHKHGF